MIPQETADAINVLNGHARAHGCGKRAIYSYKTIAALVEAHAGGLVTRPVGCMLKCRYCDGTTIYRGWDGEARGRCHHCNKGYVHLRFCETQIRGHTWHHPWPTGGADIMLTAWKIKEFNYRDGVEIATFEDGTTREVCYDHAGDWNPNTPGNRLYGEEAAHQLNVVEAWLVSGLGDPRSYVTSLCWPIERARREMHQYALELGRIGTACYLCGGETYIHLGSMKRLLRWSTPVCADHYSIQPKVWPQEPAPDAITPEVEDWLIRRGWRRGASLDVREAA